VQADEMTGISYSGNLSLKVSGSVFGDIVGNYSGGVPLGNLVTSFKTSISTLEVSGSVSGSIVGAGALNKVSVAGGLDRLTTAHDGAWQYNFGDGAKALAPYTPAAKVAGGSINSATIGEANLIQTGTGGAGAAGGSINGLTMVADANGIDIVAGRGGDDARGGVGGAVSNVIVYGASQDSLSPLPIKIQAGDGGISTAATGGAGGNVAKVYIGYETIGGKLLPSPVPPSSMVEVFGGQGGTGATGGRGGNVDTVQILVSTKDVALQDEISVAGGAGGAGTARNGVGGNVTSLSAQNVSFNDANPAADLDSISIRGGDAGAGSGEGAAGGSVSKVNALADGIKIFGGQGSNGARNGGNGGGLSDISLAYSETERAQFIQLEAGSGGNGTSSGRGGAGGGIAKVSALLTNLSDAGFGPSVVRAGDGGNGGTGGVGGVMSSIRLFEPSDDLVAASIKMQSGSGGDGVGLGGRGGAVTDVAFIGFATSPTVSAGAGGAALAGAGGAGGARSKVAMKSDATSGLVYARSGSGGAGGGNTGRGGAGGTLAEVNLQASSQVEIRAGDGGAGVAAVGLGGAVNKSSAITSGEASAVEGGSAGVPTGAATKGAVGGSIRSVLAVSSGDTNIAAGNGSAGGAGGSITTAGWYAGVFSGQSITGVTAPGGTVTVQAGHGSALGNAAGGGGFLKDLAGFASSDPNKAVLIAAGDGNGAGAPQAAKGAAGGAVTNVYLYGGAAAGVIRGGDGGSAAGTNGGAGGAVTNVAAAEGVDLHAVSAGNGGAGSRGGAGGAVSRINIFGDIGVRAGKDFGFDSMGGIFAGSGGTGATAGKAGNVTDVAAAAISSIVAGRPLAADPSTLGLATLVDRIYLRGLAAPTVNANGSFSAITAPAELPSPGFPSGKPATVAYAEANNVGGVAGSPFDAGANIFKTTGGPVAAAEVIVPNLSDFAPRDGLVAALTLGPNKNFRPQAVLTVTDPKVPTTFVLLDYRNDYQSNS
jgi:hypothetical protein